MANLYQDLGDYYIEKKAYSDAVSAYQAVLAFMPGRHYVRVRLAKIYRDQLDQPGDAIQELERTIELGDEQWQAIAYGELGYTYLLMGEMERALSTLQKSIAMDQNVAIPHFYLGRLLEQEGQLDLACEEYHTALALNPDAQWIENVYTQVCASPK
jgi:tetratricopeptide (TPR) repeat protein